VNDAAAQLAHSLDVGQLALEPVPPFAIPRRVLIRGEQKR